MPLHFSAHFPDFTFIISIFSSYEFTGKFTKILIPLLQLHIGYFARHPGSWNFDSGPVAHDDIKFAVTA